VRMDGRARAFLRHDFGHEIAGAHRVAQLRVIEHKACDRGLQLLHGRQRRGAAQQARQGAGLSFNNAAALQEAQQGVGVAVGQSKTAPRRLKNLKTTVYVGPNIFDPNPLVRMTVDLGAPPGFTPLDPTLKRTTMNWAIDPPAIYASISRIAAVSKGLPIYVTENGGSFADVVGPDGVVNDQDRIGLLDGYLAEVARARAYGMNVRGYLIWSLLDNFEWAHGYSRRFGLVHVDYETLKRTPKASYHWYAALAQSKRLPQALCPAGLQGVFRSLWKRPEASEKRLGIRL
jgi:Glycosyl hydrolase family 1